jgi:hypothetical protein
MLIAAALGQVSRDYGGVQQTLVLVTGDGNSNGGGNWVRRLYTLSLSTLHQRAY